MGILTLLVLLPLAGGLWIMFTPLTGINRKALIVSVLTLLFSFDLLSLFNPQLSGPQLREYAAWMPRFNINYHLGIDGISLLFLLLVVILVPFCIYAGRNFQINHTKAYHCLLLALESALIGTLVSRDPFLIFAFWEIVGLIVFFLIGIWGNGKRVDTAVKYYLFHLIGGAFLLIGIAGWHPALPGSITATAVNPKLWFICLLAGCAIRIPLTPLHSWLPDLYRDCPDRIRPLLAAALPTLAFSVMIRRALPITVVDYAPTIIGLALAGVIVINLIASEHDTFDRLLAYASISISGLAIAGLISGTLAGSAGAVLLVLTLGIVMMFRSGLYIVLVFTALTGFSAVALTCTGIFSFHPLAGFIAIFAVFLMLLRVVPLIIKFDAGYHDAV